MPRVLVVDDSALMRQFLCELLGPERDLQIATARDGREALQQLHSFKPDVITLDINMPEMDGLTALAHIMTERPTPVVVVSSLSERGAMVTLEALAMGAVDYIQKPGGTISLGMDEVAAEVRRKIRAACSARIGPIPAALPTPEALPVMSQRNRRALDEDVRAGATRFEAGVRAAVRRSGLPAAQARRNPVKRSGQGFAALEAKPQARAPKIQTPAPALAPSASGPAVGVPVAGGSDRGSSAEGGASCSANGQERTRDLTPGYADPDGLVLIGVSTGGPRVLPEILRMISPQLRWSVVICQHMPDSFTESFARRLDELCPLPVREVREEVPVKPGHVYLARGGFDLAFHRRDGRLWVTTEPERAKYLWHPSVEHMVNSAMRHLEARRLIGVMLTGMGYDGAEAMLTLKKQGGRTVAESKDTAVVYGMPKELIERGGATKVVPSHEIPAVLHDWLGCKA